MKSLAVRLVAPEHRKWLVAGALFLLAVGMVLTTLLSADGWSQRQKARADLRALREENARLATQVQELQLEIRALRSRPEVQERIVRDELGFGRASDTIIEVAPAAPEPAGN